MHDTDVIIVGGGPSGLALAVALSRMEIHSVVLEKEHDICEDPRAIALAGDAHRILSLLGISEEYFYGKIGQPLHAIHFHNGSFTSAPFFHLGLREDWNHQVSANASVFLQPQLEQVLRDMADASPYVTLKLGCTVVEINQTGQHASAGYETKGTPGKSVVRAKYLVGADGKRGFVRKGYLEERGVRQVTGTYPYESTWVAANLRITMPIPESHPDFPLWDLGYEPEELWDIFWPGDWHFCAHPTMPVATGRFGPASEKLWSRQGRKPRFPVRFPWDCVQVLRCNPAFFAQKVVTKWFDGRVILIGDAAHVFPPFGAQGIASGLRDALSLSWRLSLLCRPDRDEKPPSNMSDAMLEAWSRERRQGVDEASKMTAANGSLMHTKSVLFSTAVWIAGNLISLLPLFHNMLLRYHFSDAAGFSGVEGGFFLQGQGGGGKSAQVFTKTPGQSLTLSDAVFFKPENALTVLALCSPEKEDLLALRQLIERGRSQSPRLISEGAIILQEEVPDLKSWSRSLPHAGILIPVTSDELWLKGMSPPALYQAGDFRRRFLPKSRYALMRPDFIIFSQAETLEQLKSQMDRAEKLASAEDDS